MHRVPAKEHERYTSGTDRVIISCNSWWICLQVYHNLTLPVFSRNRNGYDLLIYWRIGRQRGPMSGHPF